MWQGTAAAHTIIAMMWCSACPAHSTCSCSTPEHPQQLHTSRWRSACMPCAILHLRMSPCGCTHSGILQHALSHVICTHNHHTQCVVDVWPHVGLQENIRGSTSTHNHGMMWCSAATLYVLRSSLEVLAYPSKLWPHAPLTAGYTPAIQPSRGDELMARSCNSLPARKYSNPFHHTTRDHCKSDHYLWRWCIALSPSGEQLLVASIPAR